jgi:hypothetical protein
MAEKPKGGPKSKPASSTLYVKDPNDSRLKMYEDSVTASGRAININNVVNSMKSMPMEKRRLIYTKGVSSPPEAKAAISRLENANKKRYEIARDSSVSVNVDAPKGYGYNTGARIATPGGKENNLNVYGSKVFSPKRKVELVKPPRPKPEPKPKPAPERKVSEPIEPMQPKAASTKLAKPEPEMVAPVVRPVKANKPAVVAQKTEPRKMPKAVMPTRQGGWSKQPLVKRLFPKLYAK